MTGKILNIEKPIISNIPRDNFIFTVLNNNKSVLTTFVLHNYIEVFSLYTERSHDFSFRYYDFTHCFVQKKYFQYSITPREVIESNNHDVINKIKKLIDLDFYISINVDCFYLKAYNAKNHYSHEVMVFGYNDDLNLLYITDFFDGVMYSTNECAFNELSMAFNSVNKLNLPVYYDGIIALKLNPSPDYSVDYVDIKTKLHTFNNAVFHKNAIINYGKSIFDIIEYQLKDERNHNAPMRFLLTKFNFIKDCIFLMKMRIDYFNQLDNFELSEEQSILKDLIQKMDTLKNICLKMLLTNERFNIQQNTMFIIKIKEISSKYQEVINSFYKKLSESI